MHPQPGKTAIVLFLTIGWFPLAAQVPAGAQTSPEFEVAVIKSTDPTVRHMTGVTILPGARIRISALPLKTLIAMAFDLSHWEISGGDAWIQRDGYDIEAKPPENVRIADRRYTLYGIEDPQLRAMLQRLLIDRFQLKFHRETQTGNVYALKTSGKTLRLRPSEAPPGAAAQEEGAFTGDVGFSGGRWVIFHTTMPQLAKVASDRVLHAPVADQTELSGPFDYKQTTRLDDSEANYSDPSDSFLRLIVELGLKLERSKGPVETFIIDHASRPSAN